MDTIETIELEDGKYTIESHNGILLFKRNGEYWPAANDLKYSKLVGAMFNRIIELDKLDKPVEMLCSDWFGRTIDLLWQGKADGTCRAFEINGMMGIPSRDGVTYVRDIDAEKFFGLNNVEALRAKVKELEDENDRLRKS